MRKKHLFGGPEVKETIVPSMPYMGTKRKLVNKILNAIYRKIGDFNTLYDLFGGGAAMSVAALNAGHKVHYNEKNPAIAELFNYIKMGGELPNHWVPREEFHQKKGGDTWFAGILQTCWSFCNNQKDYMYGKPLEPIKKLIHLIIVNKDESALEELSNILGVQLSMPVDRLDFKPQLRKLPPHIPYKNLAHIQHLERMDSLIRLQKVENIQTITVSNLDYREVEIDAEDSIIYCDPPYINTEKYHISDFNHVAFWDWCRTVKRPVFFSEYTAPDDFEIVATFNHESPIGSASEHIRKHKQTIENVYWNGKCM
jgi:site-specific DNA-adenine methylase